jgi:hypothetical protein
MTYDPLRRYRQIWLVDFEYCQPPGERPVPICMVAREYQSGQTLRIWSDDLARMTAAPFPADAGCLFVAYFASAELSCLQTLGWPTPLRVLDLFCEFRWLTNGRPTVAGNGLLGALAYFGLAAIDAAEKKEMRDLAMRGGPYNAAERLALLDYCESDVLALAKLLPKMADKIDLPRALLRGRYMAAVARMELHGVPIDVGTLAAIRAAWKDIQADLIGKVDSDFGVYDGLAFKRDRFAMWLARNRIPWPRLESGELALDDESFRQMARGYPAVAPLRELRHTLGELRLESLAVGRDGRNRCLLSPFQSMTGRNQPSNSRFIFGPSCWLRSLIQPAAGRAVAYVDYEQQEFGIAAALSGDAAMEAAYATFDPYLTFAKQAGAAPVDATKTTHPCEREQYKQCVLAVQDGMGPRSLADKIGQPEAMARELLRLHRATYPSFWKWSEAAVNHAMLRGWLHTVFGWPVRVGPRANPRSLSNFPMQANGAEMLRLACCIATERGLQLCAPVHDAVLVEGPADEIQDVVARTQDAMAEASRVVLAGFELRTEAKIVAHPDRYMDKRGRRMWEIVTDLLARKSVGDLHHRGTGYMCQRGTGTCATVAHLSYLISLLCFFS